MRAALSVRVYLVSADGWNECTGCVRGTQGARRALDAHIVERATVGELHENARAVQATRVELATLTRRVEATRRGAAEQGPVAEAAVH